MDISSGYFRKSENGFALIILFGIVCIVSKTRGDEFPEPYFAEPIPNITVSEGSRAILPCVVKNLGNFQVSWIHARPYYTVLSLQLRMISRNPRYAVTRSRNGTWWLHISDVREREEGEYLCRINTIPMKNQAGYLTVVVPPEIDEEKTSSDTVVREGNDVHLVCATQRTRNLETKWIREDGLDIPFRNEKVSEVHGMYLNITNVSRHHMGAYVCIASNVMHSVRRRIMLDVTFPPEVQIPNQLVGAPIGADVVLGCNLESHPRSATFWITEEGLIILSDVKYDSTFTSSIHYKQGMSLKIRNLKPEDFRSYTCVARNSLGAVEGTIRLYEIRPSPSQPATKAPDTFQDKPEMLQNGSMSILESESEGHNRSERESPKSSFLLFAIFAYLLINMGLQNSAT